MRAALPAEPLEAKYWVGDIVLGAGGGCRGPQGGHWRGALRSRRAAGEAGGAVAFLCGATLVALWGHPCPGAWDWLSPGAAERRAVPCHHMLMAGQSRGDARLAGGCAAPGPAHSLAGRGAKPPSCCTRCWLRPRAMELPLLPRRGVSSGAV